MPREVGRLRELEVLHALAKPGELLTMASLARVGAKRGSPAVQRRHITRP
jgi:hypothetical protein